MHKRFLYRFLLILGGCLLFASSTFASQLWRGQIKVAEGWAPFLIDIENAKTTGSSWTLINGSERVQLPAKYIGDSVFVQIEAFDAQIKASISQNGERISGRIIKNYLEKDTGLIFSAISSASRFENRIINTADDISGKWDIWMGNEKEHNVGIFQLKDSKVTGSILTSSGDMRYLEGVPTVKGFVLSAFSGLSPYLFDFEFKNDSMFVGRLHTSRIIIPFEGKRNPLAKLEDAYGICKMKPGEDRLMFKLKDLTGKMVSINDSVFKDKVVIVSVLGSWCPNCLDEHAYLADWYKQNKSRGVEIVGVAFERKSDPAYARQTLTRLKTKYGITYPLLFGGKVGKESIASVFPEIMNFNGYPTTFFIGRDGRVKKIHTGFNGPATGLFYEEFQQEFNQLVDELLQSK